MKKTFACAVRPNKAPSMRRGLSIISLEHSYGLNGSRIFDPTQLAPLHCGALEAISRFFFSNSKKNLPVIRTHCVSIHTKFQLYSIQIE